MYESQFWILLILTPAVLCLLLLMLAIAWAVSCLTAGTRRHWHYRRQASRVLARLPQLAADAQRMVYLRQVNPYVFEELLLTAFARCGYRIRRNARYSGDGGIDGQVWIDGQRWLIQAKRFAATIRQEHVRAFGELVRREQCRGFFIHTGRTGTVCHDAFQTYPELRRISGQQLLRLLASAPDWQASAVGEGGYERSLRR